MAAFDQIRLLHLKKYLLCTLLILKEIQFSKQRRKKICWIWKIGSSRSQMVLNIGENFEEKISQESICVGVSFLIKLLAFSFIKRDFNTGVFL